MYRIQMFMKIKKYIPLCSEKEKESFIHRIADIDFLNNTLQFTIEQRTRFLSQLKTVIREFGQIFFVNKDFFTQN